MKLAKYIETALIMLVTIMSSCTEDFLKSPSGDIPIQVTTSFADETNVKSRAGSNLNEQKFDILTSVNAASKVRVFIDDGSYNYRSNIYDVSSTNAITPESQPYFPALVNAVNIYAWYPYNNGNTSFTINTDQTGDDNYRLSDLMVAQPTTCSRSQLTDYGTWTVSPARLQFQHMMSKVCVTVVPTALTITKVELVNVCPTVEIGTVTSGGMVTKVNVGTATGTAGAVTLWSGSSTASVTVTGIIPAQSIAGNFIKITSSGNVVTYFDLGSTGKQFDQNTTYSATLNLNSSNVGKTIDISPWGATDETLAVMSSKINTFCTMTAELDEHGREYNGLPFKPNPTVTYTQTENGLSTILTKGTDYVVHYTTEDGTRIEEPISYGSYYCVVTGIGNYSGTIQLHFTIARNLEINTSDFKLYVYNTISGKTDFSTLTVTAPENVTWSVTSNNTSVATVTNYTTSGTTCTITVRGQAEGSTSFNIRATGAECSYSKVANCQVLKSMTLMDVNENEARFVKYAVTSNGYLYASGTDATNAGETVIGMIAYIGANGSAEASGSYKGLIVGAQPGLGGADWAPEQTAAYSTTYDQLGYYTDNIAKCKTDMYGLAYTAKMIPWGETLAGAQAVIRGNAIVDGGIVGMTSTWFLPAIGQFLKAFDGVYGSEVIPDSYVMTSNYTAGLAAMNAMNTALLNAGCDKFQDTDYWTSSESSAANVVNPDLYVNEGYLRIDIGGTAKVNRRKQLSPFLAF